MIILNDYELTLKEKLKLSAGVGVYRPSSSANFDVGSIASTLYEFYEEGFDAETIKSEFEKKKIRPIEKNDMIKKLSDAYKKNNLVLVIGAGISINQGGPKWEVLLQELLSKALEKEGTTQTMADILSKLFINQFSENPLIT